MRGSLLLALGGLGLFACAETSPDDQMGAVREPGTPNIGAGAEGFGPPPLGELSDPEEMAGPDAVTGPATDVNVDPATDDPTLVPPVPSEPDAFEPVPGGDQDSGGGDGQLGTQTGDQGSGGAGGSGQLGTQTGDQGSAGAGPSGGGAPCDPITELPFPEETRWVGTTSAPGPLTSDGDAASLVLAYTDSGRRECTIVVEATLSFTSDGLSFTTDFSLWLYSDGANGVITVPGSAVTPQSALPALDAFEPFDVMGDNDGQAGIAGVGGEGGSISGPGGMGGRFGIGGAGGAPPNASSGPGGAGPNGDPGVGGAAPPTGGASPGSASGGFTPEMGGMPWLLQTGGSPQGGATSELAECSVPTWTTTDSNPVGVSLRGALTIDATTGTSALELAWMRGDEDGSTWYSIGQGCAEFELVTE